MQMRLPMPSPERDAPLQVTCYVRRVVAGRAVWAWLWLVVACLPIPERTFSELPVDAGAPQADAQVPPPDCNPACGEGRECFEGACVGPASVSVGHFDACATWRSGKLSCWGTDVGTAEQNPSAFDLAGIDDVLVTHGGSSFRCLLRRHGSVACWGDRRDGRTGLQASTQRARAPIDVPLSADASGLAVGDAFACALTTTGAVHCWGSNGEGQLGIAPGPSSSAAVRVRTDRAFDAITAGGEHACALEMGAVYCWGANDDGQSGGDGPGLVDTGVRDAVRIDAGTKHTCAQLGDGTLSCWGAAPVLSRGTVIDDFAASGAQTCVITAGRVTCSGTWSEYYDQWADGPITPNLTTASTIALGPNGGCAIDTAGDVSCWGWRAYGQLGDGRSSIGSAQVVTASVARVSASKRSTCVVTTDQRVECWGDNRYGQLGNGAVGAVSAAAPVGTLSGASEVGLEQGGGCAVAGDALYCWGRNDSGQAGHPAAPEPITSPVEHRTLRDVRGLGVGYFHRCALVGPTRAGWCWGLNRHGTIGPASGADARAMSNLDGATMITAGLWQGCAVVGSEARCWGWNGHGEIDGTARSVALDVTRLPVTKPVVSVAAGIEFNCTLHDDGTVSCGGNNDAGQRGSGTFEPIAGFTEVRGLTDVMALDANQDTACAVDRGGAVWCWGGDRGFGVLGGGGTRDRATPALVDGVSGAVSVAVGSTHACAVRADGVLLCWGGDEWGQRSGRSPVALDPVPVVGL